MFSVARARKVMLGVLLGFFICWPPLHMLLSTIYGFSSWKFAGWGMYATPFTPKNEVLHVYIFPQDAPKALPALSNGWLQPASLKESIEIYYWGKGGFIKIPPPKNAARVIRSANRAKLLGSLASVENIVENIEKGWNLQNRRMRMLVLVIEPRIHPLERLTYAEVNVFASDRNRVRELGSFKTDSVRLSSLIPGFFEMNRPPARKPPASRRQPAPPGD